MLSTITTFILGFAVGAMLATLVFIIKILKGEYIYVDDSER